MSETIPHVCGQIGRRLLGWIWQQRESKEQGDTWAEALGSSWVVPIVVKTFETDPQASRSLLQRILDLVKEEDFPISFLYRLTHHLDRIWPYDAEFAAQVYLTVFHHYETSEEKTSMGTPIVPLSSTRRQDYQMCQYNLTEHFPRFLREAPVLAAQSVIRCLNFYIIGQHVAGYLEEGVELKDLPEEFQFRGKAACYITDASYVWDQGDRMDEPIKMADELFAFIDELSSSETGTAILDSLLDVFRDNVWAAFFWRRILRTAAQVPEVFVQRLFELCIARPIQIGSETLRELGLFLEAAACHFTSEQLRQIEEAILTLPEEGEECGSPDYLEYCRDRLLARIPIGLLETEEARSLRKLMEQADRVPGNEPLVTGPEFHWEPYPEEDWLKEKGVDLDLPENVALRELLVPLEKFTSEWQNKIPSSEATKSVLPAVKELYAILHTSPNAHKAVLDSAWTKLASCAETMSRSADDPQNEEFQFCREVLLVCSKHELPRPDPEYDAKYNAPFWSPAPRNEAAEGLPWLAARKPDSVILQAMNILVHDKVPSVRYLVTRELFRISRSAPGFFWALAEDIAENEASQVVQRALCQTLGRVMAQDETKTSEVLNRLFNRVFSPDEDSDLLESLVSLIVRLLLVYENKWAGEAINSFLAEPVRLAKPLKRATYIISLYINLENLVLSRYPKAAERTTDWLSRAIDSSVEGIGQLRCAEELDEEKQSKLGDLYGVIDQLITHLYQQVKIIAGQESIRDEQREGFYTEIKPLLEQVLEFALDKKNGMMFAPTAHNFIELLNDTLKYDPRGVLHMAAGVAESSKAFGYNMDSLAVREVVKLVEAVLANYRSEVREGESLQDLLNLLDVFAEAGWPEALNLVWRLDEIFR